MIACIAPSDRFFEENVSTLNYATRASYIANAPTKNIDPKIREIQELKKKNKSLQLELYNANQHIEFLTSMTSEELKQFGSTLITQNFNKDNKSDMSTLKTSSPVKTRGKSQNPKLAKNQSHGTSTGTSGGVGTGVGVGVGTSIGSSSNTLSLPKAHGAAGMSTQTDTKMLISSQNKAKSSRSRSKDPYGEAEIRSSKQHIANKKEFEKKMKMISSEITAMGMNNEGNSNRFTDAMTRVTDLLKVNQMLRDENNAKEDSIRKKNVELFQLKEEGEELRDRIELLETIVQADSGTFEKYVSSHLFSKAQQTKMSHYMGYDQG